MTIGQMVYVGLCILAALMTLIGYASIIESSSRPQFMDDEEYAECMNYFLAEQEKL